MMSDYATLTREACANTAPQKRASSVSADAILRIASAHLSETSSAIKHTCSIVGICSGPRMQEISEMFFALSHKKQRAFVPVLVWAPLGGPSRRKYETQPFR